MAFVSGTVGQCGVCFRRHNCDRQRIPVVELDVTQNAPEVTAFGDSFKNFIQGIREWKGSLGVRADPSQASQDVVRNMLIGGSAPIVFRFFMGSNYYSGSAFPSNGKPEIAYDGAAMLSYDLQGCGSLSYT
jgi:hypothetical protein